MNRGIYIVANDKVIDNAIALLNSIRVYDPQVAIYLVPFDQNYQKIADILGQKHDVKLFPDLEFIEDFTQKIGEIFDRDFLVLPNKLRKFALWFGPLDKFIYIDTDIVVFQKLSAVLDYLDDYEFLCCDYHSKKRKIKDIFSEFVIEKAIFSKPQLEDVFNSGFWASKKGIFSESRLYQLLKECAEHREYFDFSSKTTDQPLLNYVILKSTQKRLNLVKIHDNEPGSWAGSTHFQERDRILYDGEQPLRYVHWAGTPMRSGGPYRELWEYYRYLGESKPPNLSSPPENQWRKFAQKVKKYLKLSK